MRVLFLKFTCQLGHGERRKRLESTPQTSQVLGSVVEETGLGVEKNLWSSQQVCCDAECAKDTDSCLLILE